MFSKVNKKNALVVGAGFLGGCVAEKLGSFCAKVIRTRKNKICSAGNSEQFDFFNDDIGAIMRRNAVNVVVLSAKIEFHSDKSLLLKAMEDFLKSCGGKRLVYVSSDGIFDGRQGNYAEQQLPSPVTPYGERLLLCEELVAIYSSDYCIVRPSYIYGHSLGRLDSRLGSATLEAEGGGRVERFLDMFKSPLHVCQVAEAVAKLAFSDYVGIIHVAGERKSVFDFTREGMEALDVSVERLVGVPMPQDRPKEFLPDTSLNFDLMRELTGICPMSIKESFQNFGNKKSIE